MRNVKKKGQTACAYHHLCEIPYKINVHCLCVPTVFQAYYPNHVIQFPYTFSCVIILVYAFSTKNPGSIWILLQDIHSLFSFDFQSCLKPILCYSCEKWNCIDNWGGRHDFDQGQKRQELQTQMQIGLQQGSGWEFQFWTYIKIMQEKGSSFRQGAVQDVGVGRD